MTALDAQEDSVSEGTMTFLYLGALSWFIGFVVFTPNMYRYIDQREEEKTDRSCNSRTPCQRPTDKQNNLIGKCLKGKGRTDGKCTYTNVNASRIRMWIWIGIAMMIVGVCVMGVAYLWSERRRS
jgi:hypothetical protein